MRGSFRFWIFFICGGETEMQIDEMVSMRVVVGHNNRERERGGCILNFQNKNELIHILICVLK